MVGPEHTHRGLAYPVRREPPLGRRRGRHCSCDHGDAARAPKGPAGSYFEDGDRAAGVFGVLATGFAVLLGFVVFLAFESFDTSRSGAEAEAEIVASSSRRRSSSRSPARAALGRARLLRADGDPPGVAADGGGHARRRGQSVGRRYVPHPQ